MPEDIAIKSPLEPGAAFRSHEEDRLRGLGPHQREEIDVVVIGAGQAGLSASYHLKRRGIAHVVLEAAPRIGDVWRKRWDSLRLFTPARFTGLDGMAFPKGRYDFATKDEMADYLEAYAARFSLPVRLNVRVQELRSEGDRYLLDIGDGEITARQVVIAAASAQKPKRPAWSVDLDPTIKQIDARDYRNPEQLDGPILVVGFGNSGAEIASDLVGIHQVLLSGNSPGELPVPYDSWFAGRVLMPFLFKVLFHRILTTSTPMGRKALPHAIAHSHPLIRVRRRHLAAAGVTFLPKTSGVCDGKPLFEDGATLDVASIVWCTGYSCGLDWVKLPIFDGNARPRQVKGSVSGQPGLHVVGLHFQRAESSIMIHGVGTDARLVAAEVARRVRAV